VVTEITHALDALDRGEPGASDKLLEIVYGELRQLAAINLARERCGHTLVPTALVHEAYLRLLGTPQSPSWKTRGHFFAAAAEAMRRILVDHARRKRSKKRGGDWRRSDMPLDGLPDEAADDRLLALDEGLIQLEKQDPDVAQLVKLRYFSGLTIEDAASALGVSPRTAVSWWTYARTYLAAAVATEASGRKSTSDERVIQDPQNG
jgi:RNA polymerase sigma factor (TIGR02999 family)